METEMKNLSHSRRRKGPELALLLILIGGVFLGVNLGLIHAELKDLILSWQMLVIAIGLIKCFKFHFIKGSILILVGIFFILPKVVLIYPNLFPNIDPYFAQKYWPLLLILGGLLLMFMPKCKDCYKEGFSHSHTCFKKKKNAGRFHRNSIFGSGEYIVFDPIFSGGEVNAIFGGILVDLRRTSLPLGETYLDVNAVFGGITIIAPNDWVIETRFETIAGAFRDNRMSPNGAVDSERKLLITGSCVFGGGEIRN